MKNIVKNVIIPDGFILIVDDVGWWMPAERRYYVDIPEWVQSLMHRPNYLEDYRSLVEIGRATGMRVLCGFTIGEWDRERLLARVPNSNMYGSTWTNAEVMANSERLDEARDYINANRDYIEMAIHGLNHMYWDDETHKCSYAEYYRMENGRLVMLNQSVMRRHLDAWFEIYQKNGFKEPVDKLIPPCFRYRYSRGNGELSYILKDYGIRYVSTPFSSMQYDTPEKPTDACVENGILTTDRTNDYSQWYEMDAGIPEKPLKNSAYGTHWPHFFAKDPKDNGKTVERWVNYFKRYYEHFPVIVARNQEMAANQCFYKRFTSINTEENSLILDFTEADKEAGTDAKGIGKTVYLNVKKPFRLSNADESCRVTLYSRAAEFVTYQVERNGRYAKLRIE